MERHLKYFGTSAPRRCRRSKSSNGREDNKSVAFRLENENVVIRVIRVIRVVIRVVIREITLSCLCENKRLEEHGRSATADKMN